MSKADPQAGTAQLKRKHDDEDRSKSSKRRRRQHTDKPKQSITTTGTVLKPEGTGKSKANNAKPVVKDQRPQRSVSKASWAVSNANGGRYADRDPIFLQNTLVTAIGDTVKVLSVTSSLQIASLSPPPGAGIVSFDAVRTENENLVRILYNDGALVDWDWTTDSTDESKLGTANVDLYRLMLVGHRIASIFTTWRNGRCTILLDGIELYKTEHRITDVKSLPGIGVIAALCQSAIIMGRKDSSDKYTWIELPWSARATCFDARERGGSKGQDFSLVVGQEDGSLQHYNDISSVFTTGKLLSPQRLHWHRHAVDAVKFSPDGNYIISGGQETVLVMWQLATGSRSYLPNLASPIERIVVNKAGDRYALKMGDNSIIVLSTTELKPVANFTGLQMSQGKRLAVTIDPTNRQQLLLSSATTQRAVARPFLQTFDTSSDKQASRQALTRNNVTDLKDGPDKRPILPPDVEHLAVSNDGKWLATIDTWTPPHRDFMYLATEELMSNEDRLARREVYLKFWRWNASTGGWMLNSRIDQPHSYGSTIAEIFKLVSDTTKPGFVTIGEDSTVRIWRPQRKVRHGLANQDEEEVEWICRNTIELEKTEDRTDLELEGSSPTNAALSISDDGSLLAACILSGEQQVIHLIDVETGEVKSSNANIAAPELVDIAFVDRYIAALSRRTLRVWDVVEDRLHYITRVQASSSSLLAISRADNVIAVASPAVAAAPNAITIYQLQPAELQCRVVTEQPVSAILAHPRERGFKIMFGDATTATLSSVSALSTAQQAALVQEAAIDTAIVPMAGAPTQLVEPDAAVISESAGGQVEDDRTVVRPEQLAQIFDVGMSATALPTLREMFHAVADLFSRKPRLMI